MKKIFSLSLMAVALLISGQAKAATLTVGATGDYLTLESAFSAANSGDVIKLVGDVTVGSSIEINGKNLTLDMNGRNAEMNTVPTDGMKKPWMFVIFKGSLNVTGQGQILNSVPQLNDSKGNPTYKNGSEIITIKLLGSVNASDANFTTLTIGKDVEVVANPGKAGVNIDGWASVGTTKCQTEYPTMTYAAGMAYGVVVNIYGKVNGQKYGVQISGNLSKMDKNNKTNWPQVNIKPGSVVWSQPEENESIGFYAAGQGNSMVEGTVHASTGVYVKGGAVEIHDAYVYSDNSNYSEPEAKGSGVDACGSAVVVDSKSGYAGAQEVKISGDTKLEGAGGYAIEEVITETKDGGTMVQAVTIDGGVIVGGDKGALTFTEKTTEEEKVTVFDGTFDGTTTIGGEEQETPAMLFPQGEDKHVTIVDGMMVVSDGAAPVAATKDINELTENTDIQYNDSRNMTLTKDLTFKVVELIGEDTLTIPEDKTLKVDKLVLGADAQVVVKAGGTLLVMGNAGVISNYPENLLIEASSENMGTFVYNPAVQSGRSPMATVEFWDKAGKLDGDRYWSMFTCPFAKVDTIYTANNDPLYIQWIDTEAKMWKNFPGGRKEFIATAQPFQMISTTNDNDINNGHKIVMKGQLQGNTAGKFSLKKGFNYIGNGYLANMDASQMISLLMAASNKIYPIFYTYSVAGGFESHNAYVPFAEKLKGMNGFVLYATEDIPEVVLDYTTLIWNQYNQ